MAVYPTSRPAWLHHRDIALVEGSDHSATQHRHVPFTHRLNLSKQSREEDVFADVGFVGRRVDKFVEDHDSGSPQLIGILQMRDGDVVRWVSMPDPKLDVNDCLVKVAFD